MTPPARQLPLLALTAAESKDLRDKVERALTDAQDAFISAHVVRDADGAPTHGPDPRAVHVEMLYTLARYLARANFDLVNAAGFEARLRQLETELDRLNPAFAIGTPLPRALEAPPAHPTSLGDVWIGTTTPAPPRRLQDPTTTCVKCGGPVADEQDCPRCY